MSNLIGFTLEETFCLPARDLYSFDPKTLEKNHYTIKWAYVYFITKLPKYRILKVLTGRDYIEVIISKRGENVIKITNKLTVLLKLDYLVSFLIKEKFLIKKDKQTIKYEILKVEDFSIEFLLEINDYKSRIIIPIQEILINAELNEEVMTFIEKPEIIYIGKTLKKIKRFLSHSKLQKSLCECGQEEDIFIWPTIFKTDFLTLDGKDISSKFLSTAKDLDIDKKKIDLLELLLIQFYKPLYNEKLIQSNLKTNKLIIHYKNFDVNSLLIQCYCEQFFCNFWSANQILKHHQHGFLCIDLIEHGFSKDLIIKNENSIQIKELGIEGLTYSNPVNQVDYFQIDKEIFKNW